MRFVMFMIPGVYQGGKEIGPDFAPSAEAVAAMTKYNEALANAGALISLDGLTPPSMAARVSFAGGKPTVTDGPFSETKEVIGGYWVIRAKSREEAIEWARKVPVEAGDVIEVRQVFEMEDFPDEVRKAGESSVVREQLAR